MKKLFQSALLAVFGTASLWGGMAVGQQQPNFGSMNLANYAPAAPMAYEGMHHQQAAPGGCTSCGQSACESTCQPACTPCCNTCCESGKFSAAAEAVLLTPHMGALAIPGVVATPDFDMNIAHRFWVAYENAEGLGVRASYFEYDHNSDAVAILGAPVSLGLKANTIDLEVFQPAKLQRWNVSLGGGLRYANHQFGLGIGAPVNGAFILDFEGIGPTISFGASRPLRNGLSLFGNVRGSFIYGDTRVADTAGVIPIPPGTRITEQLTEIYELSMGVKYERDGFFATAAIESQSWEVGQIVGFLDQSIGYVGPTFSVGYTR